MANAKRYAFLSVYNKNGIADFARELIALGWKLIASGGTAKMLANAKLPVTDLAELVGGGAILGHKVVTLDQKFHAMLLANDTPEETAELKKLSVPRIDLLCNDLYPLQEEITKPGATRESVIEKTDIGGPAMIRAAAKGGRIVICDINDRARVIQWLRRQHRVGAPTEASGLKAEDEQFLQYLRAKAEFIVAQYGFASARYHAPPAVRQGRTAGGYEAIFGEKYTGCLYGENRWQNSAALYLTNSIGNDPLAPDKFIVREGASRSYINFTDIERLLQSATHIAAAWKKNFRSIPKIAIGAKHGNLCGAAISDNPEKALRGMLSGDSQAISGGWILTNFPIDKKAAELLRTHKTEEKRILDGVIAPDFSKEAIDELARKSGKCRLISNPALATDALAILDSDLRFRYVRKGFLMQSNYTFILDLKDPDLVQEGRLTIAQKKDLLLGWAIGSTSNSNTVTLIRHGELIANATGQQSRVLACRLALMIAQTAGHETKGACAYSDSFFPFPDGPLALADAGITALLVTHGSIRDKEVFEVIRSRGLSILHLPDEKARGFYMH